MSNDIKRTGAAGERGADANGIFRKATRVTEDIDWTRLVLLDDVRFANEAHRKETYALWAKAVSHVRGMRDRLSVLQTFLAFSEAGVVGVFLLRTQAMDGAEQWLWVVVGDLPALAFPARLGRNQYQALDVYLRRVGHWIDAVEQHRLSDADDVFDHSTNPEKLAHLRRKVKLLDAHLLAPARHLL